MARDDQMQQLRQEVPDTEAKELTPLVPYLIPQEGFDPELPPAETVKRLRQNHQLVKRLVEAM